MNLNLNVLAIKVLINFILFLELTTPTFNLTSSTPSNRRNSSRKPNIDITDPIFKVPFEHGKIVVLLIITYEYLL